MYPEQMFKLAAVNFFPGDSGVIVLCMYYWMFRQQPPDLSLIVVRRVLIRQHHLCSTVVTREIVGNDHLLDGKAQEHGI